MLDCSVLQRLADDSQRLCFDASEIFSDYLRASDEFLQHVRRFCSLERAYPDQLSPDLSKYKRNDKKYVPPYDINETPRRKREFARQRFQFVLRNRKSKRYFPSLPSQVITHLRNVPPPPSTIRHARFSPSATLHLFASNIPPDDPLNSCCRSKEAIPFYFSQHLQHLLADTRVKSEIG